ncbi:MAG: erythromycin esterase family protein [Aulosira sp. DedQUE10]|nr:erythromycin esterase family protein [Aulosira sp. DedQUE10]
MIQEKGFTAVAVEADWPDAYRVNRYVRGVSDDPTPAEALSGFQLGCDKTQKYYILSTG